MSSLSIKDELITLVLDTEVDNEVAFHKVVCDSGAADPLII